MLSGFKVRVNLRGEHGVRVERRPLFFRRHEPV